MTLAPKRVEMCLEKSVYTRAVYMRLLRLCEQLSVLQCVHTAVDALCGVNRKENKGFVSFTSLSHGTHR